MNKKVCIMTSVHRHDDVRIYHKEAKALRHAGYDVVILCNDYEGTDSDGIEFIKLQVPKERTKRILLAPKLFYKKAKSIDCDYYHFHDPELLGVGVKLSKTHKVIYDVHEDVPRQILNKPYLKPATAKLASYYFEKHESRAVKKLYAIIAAVPIIYDRMKQLNDNTIMVCNYPKLEEFPPCNKEGTKDKKNNSVCYIGGITKIRGIFEMVEAIDKTDIRLVLAGEFETAQLKHQVESMSGYKNVDYRGFLGRTEVNNVLLEVAAGLVTLYPLPQYLPSLPVKMFEYMIAKVPVIASNFPYWKSIVDEASCGICIDPTKPHEIKEAIKYLIDNPEIAAQMGENGRKSVIKKYNWDIEKAKLLELYALK